ncbi:hypothetical protein GBAR_LOCUS21731, partial [Geodia barretti]
LSESPTDFFRDWNLQKARKETCGDLLAWCRADCFKGREEKRGNEEKTGEIYQLTLLLVRGKMYEQCEQIIARRCGNAGSGEQSKKKKTSSIQDLPSWLQTRPDSVFQETPRLVQVMEAGWDPGANTLSGAPPALQPNKFTSEPPSESTTPTLPAKETKTKAKREVKTTRLEQKEGGVSASVER